MKAVLLSMARTSKGDVPALSGGQQLWVIQDEDRTDHQRVQDQREHEMGGTDPVQEPEHEGSEEEDGEQVVRA